MTLIELINRFINSDAPIAHSIIQGNASTVVETEGGPVRSLAKLIADNQAAIDAQAPSLAQLSAANGSNLVGFTNIGVNAAIMTMLAKAQQTVCVDDYYRPDLGDTDHTQAFARAQAALAPRGGGQVLCPNLDTYIADQIVLKSNCIIVGRGIGSTELKQKAGANKDFIISDNFATLVGTAASAITNPNVPYWFGLEGIRVNGNKFVTGTNPSGNTAGRGVAFYGTAIQMNNVLIYGSAEDGMFTEYTDAPDATDWRGQEEGDFNNVTIRDCGGNGWLFHGPHNSKLNGITCGFNGLWGFKNESAPGYGGGIDWIGSLHTYANGRSVSPAADTGIYLGEIVRAGTLVTDGDNLEMAASNCQIGAWRCYNMGGQRGSVISGNANAISSINGNVWSSSVGQTAILVSGDSNQIGAIRLTSNNADNDGLNVTGNSNKVGPFFVQGFTAASRKGVALTGSKNRLIGEITGCLTAFTYTAGINNEVDLEITTSAGQTAVAGSAPGVTDRFNIRSSGNVAGGTDSTLQTNTFPMDITTVQTFTVAHGLLYTPGRNQVALTLLASSPLATGFVVDYMQVASTDATNVVINFKLGTAGPASSVCRIGIMCNVG